TPPCQEGPAGLEMGGREDEGSPEQGVQEEEQQDRSPCPLPFDRAAVHELAVHGVRRELLAGRLRFRQAIGFLGFRTLRYEGVFMTLARKTLSLFLLAAAWAAATAPAGPEPKAKPAPAEPPPPP